MLFSIKKRIDPFIKASILFSEENTSGVVICVAGAVSKKLSLQDESTNMGNMIVIYLNLNFMINQIYRLERNIKN
ncbi:hypothetical protein D3C87_2037040 [compost metagenome]